MNDLIQQANNLRAQAAALDAQVAQQKHAQRAQVLMQIKATVAEFAFTASELGVNKVTKSTSSSGVHPSAGKKVAVKFRDASGNTWTGRGVKPRWLSIALSNGASLASFAV